MLLSDEEISQISLSAVTVKDATADVRVIEAAILAKLAAKELPEPAMKETNPHHNSGHDPYNGLANLQWFTAAQLNEAHAQGFAAGAASQLAEKPSGYLSQYNLEMLQQGYPQTIVMIEGAKRDVPLYTRKEAK